MNLLIYFIIGFYILGIFLFNIANFLRPNRYLIDGFFWPIIIIVEFFKWLSIVPNKWKEFRKRFYSEYLDKD